MNALSSSRKKTREKRTLSTSKTNEKYCELCNNSCAHIKYTFSCLCENCQFIFYCSLVLLVRIFCFFIWCAARKTERKKVGKSHYSIYYSDCFVFVFSCCFFVLFFFLSLRYFSKFNSFQLNI